MESKAKLLGHPIHQMLIVFPLGLLAMAVVFDLISFFTGSTHWTTMAYYMIGAGLVTGVLAAIPGLIDYLAIPPDTRAKNIGALHGIGNVFVLALFGASWFMRRDQPSDPELLACLFSYMGAGLSLMTGWLGGELVDRLGVGVDEGANLNAPSSLTSENARMGSLKGV